MPRNKNKNSDRYKITNASNLVSLIVRLILMATNIFIIHNADRVGNDYRRAHNMEIPTIFIMIQHLSSWGYHQTTQYFALASLLTVFLMIRQDVSDPMFGRRLKKWLHFLSNFHLILMSTCFIIMVGYFGQVRTDAFEKDFPGCSTEFKMWSDLLHAPQYLFLLIDCLFVKEKLEQSIKFQLKPIYFSFVYFAWILFLFLVFAKQVYPVMDWVSVECYSFIGKMVVSNFFGGFVTILIRKTASRFMDPASVNKKDQKVK